MSALDFVLGGGPPRADSILLAGVRSPGVCTVMNAGSPRTWDKRKGYGYSGATLVYTGDDLSEFDVVIDIWDDTEFDTTWKPFSKLLEKVQNGGASTLVSGPFVAVNRPKALSIVHPQLNASPIKITDVVVLDASQWDQDDYGLWTMRVKFSAFRAPLPMLARPAASIPAAINKPPVAVTAADIMQQKLSAQLAGLAGP